MEKPAAVFFTIFLMLLFLNRGTPDGSYRPPLEVLKDPGGLLTLADVVATEDSADFEKVNGHGFAGGYSDDIFWFKAEIEPFEEPIQQFFLEIQPAYLNEI